MIRRQQAEFNHACVGLTVPVLFTGPGRHPGQIAGRSPWLQPVHVMAQASLIGKVVPVTIAEVGSNSLFGTLASVDRAGAADRTSEALTPVEA